MPYDDALLNNLRNISNSPEGKRKSMFNVNEAARLTNKSELGFHTTTASMLTSNLGQYNIQQSSINEE